MGFLWRMNEHWTLGGVLKTPFTADISLLITETTTQNYPVFKQSFINERTEKQRGPYVVYNHARR